MNIMWTILCFNQIEALFLLYMCNVIVNRGIKFVEIVKVHYCKVIVLALLNFIVQYIPYLFLQGSLYYFIFSVMCNFIFMPIILYIIYNKINKISFIKCYVINLYYLISCLFIINIFNLGLDVNKELSLEIFGNFLIKIIQFIIFLGGELFMKNILVKIFDNNAKTKATFTPFGYFEPKISEKLRQEISK